MKILLNLTLAAIAAMVLSPEARAQSRAQYESMVATHASANNVPEALVHRVIVRESKYHPNLVGRGGTIGLMQIKLATMLSYCARLCALASGESSNAAKAASARLGKIFIIQSLAGRELHLRTIEASGRRCGEKTAALRPDVRAVAVVQQRHNSNATLRGWCPTPAI